MKGKWYGAPFSVKVILLTGSNFLFVFWTVDYDFSRERVAETGREHRVLHPETFKQRGCSETLVAA